MNNFNSTVMMGLFLVCASVLANDAKTKAMPCTACHGIDGNSIINPEWPNLAGQHPSYVTTQLQAFKSGARKNSNMNAMAAALSDQDMADIAGYFAGQAPKVATVEAAQATAGATLYRGGNKVTGIPACMACHGPNGVGNLAAGYPALRGQHAKYTTLQLQAYRAGTRTTDPKEIMRTIAARMTDAEIDHISRFVEALH